MDAVNEKLERTVTTGDYAKVEKAVKNYMADNINNAITIAESLNDEVLTSVLTAENYMSDGLDFVKTKLLLSDMEKRLTKAKEEVKRLSEDVSEIEQSIDEVLDMITVEQKVIGFLSENKGQWTVQDGAIAFSDDALNNQYNQLLLELE